jgi:hypothetical protein
VLESHVTIVGAPDEPGTSVPDALQAASAGCDATARINPPTEPTQKASGRVGKGRMGDDLPRSRRIPGLRSKSIRPSLKKNRFKYVNQIGRVINVRERSMKPILGLGFKKLAGRD